MFSALSTILNHSNLFSPSTQKTIRTTVTFLFYNLFFIFSLLFNFNEWSIGTAKLTLMFFTINKWFDFLVWIQWSFQRQNPTRICAYTISLKGHRVLKLYRTGTMHYSLLSASLFCGSHFCLRRLFSLRISYNMNCLGI